MFLRERAEPANRSATPSWWVVLISIALACGSTDSQRADAPAIELVEDARIADTGGGPAYEFTTIDQVLQRDDTVYVRQRNVQEIRLFSTEGRHLTTIGRDGSGPGEFRALASMGFVGDTLWTIDIDLRRISYFTSDGALRTTAMYEPVSPSVGDGEIFFFPYFETLTNDGSVLGFGGWVGRDIASGKVTAIPQLRMTRTGKTLDTLAWVPVGNAHMIIQSARGSTMYRTQPYGDNAIEIYSPDGRLILVDRVAAESENSTSITVTTIESSGDTAWTNKLSYRPVRLDPVKADSLRRAYQRAHAPRFTADEVDRALYVPTFRPPVTGAISATDGAVWIRWDDETRPGGVTVLDADGSIRHTLSVAPKSRLRWASAEHLWVEQLDENDVPSLVRYRVR